MDTKAVKSKILSEIDNLLSEYISEKDSGSLRHSRESFVLGATCALDELKDNIQNDNQSLSDYFYSVLSYIESIRTDTRSSWYASQGSAYNPEARPGRREACRRIEKFVRNLYAKIEKEGKE